jgi:hypothetical protein
VPDGTLNKPFYDIQDAINFGIEMAIPNRNTQIHIHLWKGSHYLLYSPSWHYVNRKYVDKYVIDYEMTVTPLY